MSEEIPGQTVCFHGNESLFCMPCKIVNLQEDLSKATERIKRLERALGQIAEWPTYPNAREIALKALPSKTEE